MYQFSIDDITLVKNVKRSNGTHWAYYDEEMECEFNLNFSKTQKRGATDLQEGHVILLFQRVDKMQGIEPETYLTHLVTALDKELVYNEDSPTHPWERRVAVLARAEPKTAIFTFPDDLSFFKPNRGKVCPIQLLNENLTLSEIQIRVSQLFQGHFRQDAENYINSIGNILNDTSSEDFSALEGQEKENYRKHLFRERSPELIRRAKRRGMVNGRLICECCKFDFIQKYGQHGTKYIECHHKVPISTGGVRVNKVSDLALICANCHRMLHRKNEFGKYYSVSELADVIETARVK